METQLRARIAFALVFGLLCCSFAAAEASDSSEEGSEPLSPGSWSAQFQIDNNFTLTSFQGAVLSMKRHRSAGSAFRLGVTLRLEAAGRDGTSTETRNDTLTSEVVDGSDSDTQSFQIDIQYLIYPSPNSPAKLFLGFGPFGQFATGNSERVNFLSSGVSSRVRSEFTNWAIGLSGLLGVEWFAANRISFHAEYGASVRYYESKSTRVAVFRTGDLFVQDNTNESKAVEFEAKRLLFGMSVYF